MQSNNSQAKFSKDRQKEYQRQQERLKAVAATLEKTCTVSADVMIENLLKTSFKTVPEVSPSAEQGDHFYTELPHWLQCNSPGVPPQYKYLWSLVQATADLADTQKVSQLLLTSGLQIDILGFIWNLANKVIPGQLTKQEFYIVLALVSLVQIGYTFNNLSILKLLAVPSLPTLQLGLLKFPVPELDYLQKPKTANCDSNEPLGSLSIEPLKSAASPKDVRGTSILPSAGDNSISKLYLTEEVSDIYVNSNFPCIGSSPTAEIEDDFSAFQSVSVETDNDSKKVSVPVSDSCDDFSEFQSANIEHSDPFETVVLDQRREIPKIPLPKTLTGKITGIKSNLLKVSPESGKKLKVLSTAESLSSLPESKISSSNKVSTSVSILGSNHGIGSRLANHSLSGKFEKPKCHKHHRIKISQSTSTYANTESEIILGVKTKNLETVIPKCRPKTSSTHKTFILKETKIRNDEAADFFNNEVVGNELESPDISSGEKTRQIEIPMLGTFNETVLPTQSKPQINNGDLIIVQEDKYSALRDIELELNQNKNSNEKEVNDDFGDFLSADITAFGFPESPQISDKPSDLNSHLNISKNEDKDGWGDWNCNSETFLSSSNLSEDTLSSSTNLPSAADAPGLKADFDLLGSLDTLTIGDNQINSQAKTFLSKQQDFFPKLHNNEADDGVTEEMSEKSSDLLSQTKTDQGFNELDNEFWGFLTCDIQLSDETTFKRHDSLPNLDLNIQLMDDSEQDIIWKKCIDSCRSLIQEGYEIFNSINKKSVLDEVFAAPETEIYLNNLNIVCHISKRIFQNLNAFSSNRSEFEKLWERLQELCFEYNIRLKPDEDNFSEGQFRCGICCRHVGVDIISQGTSYYHPSCANLWINYVEEILPSAV